MTTEVEPRTDLPVSELSDTIRGGVTLPTSPHYDVARAVYNGSVDRRPAAVAHCADVADVIACVSFAREHDATVAVRGGGHHGAGFGVWDDALVIDLGRMRSTTVSPANHTVRADGGCQWGDVDHATGAFGMATPSGILSTTGVGGLTLGGGVGYLARGFGLTVDNLRSADVVLADGSFVTANADSHPDLYWALRGGGGNFGIVTSFTFDCHEIGENGTVIAGPVLYDIDDTEDVFRWYRDLLPGLPEELNGWIGTIIIPSGAPFPEELWGRNACAIVWCYTGPHDKADDVLTAVREFGSPLLVGLQPMPYPALQSAFDALYPKGDQWYWKADFFEEITDEAIALHVRYGNEIPTAQSTMHLYPISGAAARVAEDETAFAYRGGGWAGVMAGVDRDPANLPKIRDWSRRYWADLHPTSAGGAYVNMMMEDEGAERVRASYRGNFERLSEIKRRYDPTNLFHLNQNIPPATE
ncbi:MAG TPA: FAD-binding oxidoreductase [Nocardioides sp.]|uniref:FAD-binding oxidoreductase n=1 Tax=Nocardioides sp. TaxID=35761 RepID=UPI002D7EEF6A|nr:FAD-binding oxidoreductase [Nocardioides sp.]HET6654300.1 FAD-binding oxidoreductase [Nocardioides sp.]